MKYLDHIISSEGVRPDPKNIEAVQKFSMPKNPRNIKQFLDLAGYYWRFIKDLAARTKPLTNLLNKGVTFNWGSAEEKSFKDLKQALCESPILEYSDSQKPFTITNRCLRPRRRYSIEWGKGRNRFSSFIFFPYVKECWMQLLYCREGMFSSFIHSTTIPILCLWTGINSS